MQTPSTRLLEEERDVRQVLFEEGLAEDGGVLRGVLRWHLPAFAKGSLAQKAGAAECAGLRQKAGAAEEHDIIKLKQEVLSAQKDLKMARAWKVKYEQEKERNENITKTGQDTQTTYAAKAGAAECAGLRQKAGAAECAGLRQKAGAAECAGLRQSVPEAQDSSRQ
eukprot:gene6139-7364_t